MLSAERLAERKSGIGGSDSAAACGIPGAFKTRLELWEEKTGRAPPADLSGIAAVHFGNVLENVVCEEFTRRTGLALRRSNQLLRHPRHPFMIASLDRNVVGERAIFEAKTANAYSVSAWGPDGSDEVPLPYYMQAAHYLAVTDKDVCYLGVLLGGNDYRIYRLGRDAQVESALIERETEFWQYVQTDTPPPPSTAEDVARLHPRSNEATVLATPELIDAHRQLVEMRAQQKALDELQKPLEMKLKQALGDAEALVLPDGGKLVTWRSVKQRRFDSTRFQKDHPDLYGLYSNENEYRRFVP